MRGGFHMARLVPYAALTIALGLWLSPPGIQAAHSERFLGWGTDGKATARFSTGIVHWNSTARLMSIGFTPAPQTNGEREGFLKHGWWDDSMKQRAMSLSMEFNPGEAAASLRGLHAYQVAFYHYPGNPYGTPMSLNFIAEGSALGADLSDTFRKWGWQEFSGDLRSGGQIRGHVAFDYVYENKKNHIGPIPYRWDLAFDTVVQ